MFKEAKMMRLNGDNENCVKQLRNVDKNEENLPACYIDDVNSELLYTACVNKLYVMFLCYVL